MHTLYRHVVDTTKKTEKTNVYKFYASLDTTDQTWDYKINYCPGLGTTGNYHLLGGMFGYGITDQIISAYQFICKNYRNENDEIWLIGFSRGGIHNSIISINLFINSYTSLCCT